MRSIALLLVLLTFPLVTLAAEDYEPPPLDGGPDPATHQYALSLATSLCGAWLADDDDAVWQVAEGAYLWQQPGVALTITGQWTDPADPPAMWVNESVLLRFLVAQRELADDTPFFMPGEADYGPDGAEIPEQACLLDADRATERYNRHLENYRMWIGFNEGMDFIEPQTPVDPRAAVVFIHSGGALEFYFATDQEGYLHLVHVMAYDYFSA